MQQTEDAYYVDKKNCKKRQPIVSFQNVFSLNTVGTLEEFIALVSQQEGPSS